MVNGSDARVVIWVLLLLRIFLNLLFYFSPGDYSAAKIGLARMKYYVNIEELLTDSLELPP